MPLGQDRVVGGVPRHREGFGHPGHGQMLNNEPDQGPAHRRPREPRPRVRGARRVLAPHPTTRPAPVSAHPHQQDRRPPPERLVRQTPRHRAARRALGPAPTTEHVIIAGHDATLEHRPAGIQALPDHDETELVQAREGRQIRNIEGSVAHVEVFRVGSVRTSILGDLDPYPATATLRTATPSSAMSQYLDAPSADVDRFPGEPPDAEGVHYRDRVREFLGCGGLEPGEADCRNNFHCLAPSLGAGGEPGLEHCLGAAFDHVQQPGRAAVLANRGHVDDHRTVRPDLRRRACRAETTRAQDPWPRLPHTEGSWRGVLPCGAWNLTLFTS